MKSLMAAMVAVAIATPAGAQALGGGGNPLSPNMFGEITKPKTDVEFQQEKEREQAYKSGISKIPDAKGKVDPWGNVRIGLEATTKIDRKDFGLTWNTALETGGILVGETVHITIEAEFIKG